MAVERHTFRYLEPVVTADGARHRYRCPECGEERVLGYVAPTHIEAGEHLPAGVVVVPAGAVTPTDEERAPITALAGQAQARPRRRTT